MDRLFFSACVFLVCSVFILPPASPALAQTFVSGTVITSDGMVVSSGVVALERGELHNNEFETGGVIGSDGKFNIPLPAGGPWGLHVYSEGYLYFPLQVHIKRNENNDIPVVLPLDGNEKDDPRLSNIRFEQTGPHRVRVHMTVQDGNDNLGPQVLAIDAANFKSYRLVPVGGDIADKKADFPEGEYVSADITAEVDKLDSRQWFFVAADHQCSNGVIYNGLNQSIFSPPRPNPEPLACEIPGIWKSNFDKTYRFTASTPDRFTGEQLDGELTIKNIVKKQDFYRFSFLFENRDGKAELNLNCTDSGVELKGTFLFPDSGRRGTWIFTKLKNEKKSVSGEVLFKNNCSVCHFTDTEQRKVGPGLQGLFKRDKLPSGKPFSEENVRDQIRQGGGGMPPFGHLSEEEVRSLIEYLKSL